MLVLGPEATSFATPTITQMPTLLVLLRMSHMLVKGH